ncbi:MAG: hypothetical protein WCY89_00250 [Flavobacteriaceae bacterium]
MIIYKKCDCDDDYWEEIVVQNDENYSGQNVVYFHCSGCGNDFRVENFETGEEVFYKEM